MKHTKSLLLTLVLLVLTALSTFGAVNLPEEIQPRFDSRDGYSVDTANGAFIQDMTIVSLQGARALNLDINYNSLLSHTYGNMGRGWSNQYEGYIFETQPNIFVVRIEGNHAIFFQHDGAGNYTPLYLRGKYTTLRRFLTGEWEFGNQSGTKYFFDSTLTGNNYPLISINNRNSHPISITHRNGRPESIREGISGKQMFLFYKPVSPNLLQYVVHGSNYTFLKYDSYDRLSRIYDPTGLESVGVNSSDVDIPFGAQGITYPITVTATDTDRVIRVRAEINHANDHSIEGYLTSPSGKTVKIPIVNNANLFLDDFLGEDLSGSWSLKLIDNANDNINGAITLFRIEQSTTAANWIQYDYNIIPSSKITKISDAKGNRIASIAYDSNGRVAFQDDGRDDNGAWRFEYETQINGDMLTKVYDRTVAANKTTYIHDSENRLKSITDANNNKTQYFYYPDSFDRSKITDARGNSTEFTYDEEGHGFLTEVKEQNGAITKFAYDETMIEHEDGDFDGGVRGNLTTVTDALNHKSTFTYGPFNNLTSIENALGINQSKVYDQNGQVTITVNKNAHGVETAYTDGMVSSVNILDGPEEKIEYDASGRVNKLIDAEGNASYIEYDLNGNILEKRNDLDEKIVSTYDHQNRLITETDAEGNTTSYEYDGNGNVVRIIDALDYVTEFEYNGEDQLIRVTDDDNNSKQTLYNALGQTIQQIDELGRTISFTYDEVGNQVFIYGPAGKKISEMTYNNLNLPASQTDAHGNTTTFEYDILGQLVSRTDPEGNTTQLRIDALGRVHRVFDPLGRDYRKVFTNDDVIESISDAGRNETRFTYTEKNQVETIITPRNFVTTIEYTGSGFISRYIPPSEKAQGYTYDEASRLVKIDHTTSGAPDIINAYNKNGNITSISTQDTSISAVVPKITRTYDELNRLVSNTDADNNTVYYTYNPAGLVAKIIYPDNKTLSYSYDAAKRLKTITDWENRVTEYTWNIHNRVDSITFPNDSLRVMSYDDTGRLRGRTDFDAKGSIIVGYEYTYDRNGFVTSERLHSDPVVYEPATSTYTYDDDNRLMAKNGVNIHYDADGNITTGPISGESESFEWDAHNNLKKAGDITFNNDVEDRLIGWVNGSETVKFATVEASSGSQILVSESSLGSTSRYIYGVGLAYEEVDGQIKVHHYDERGNTVALSDASGETSGTLAYSPYGEIIGQSGDTETLFKFGGMFGVATGPNGMNYMRFRWYSPEMKRFISIDSSLGDITLPASLNRYSYAGNNPINFVDPEGEFLSALIGAVAGAVIGATVELVGSAIKGEAVNWNNVAAAAIGGAVQGAASGAGCPACGGALGSITEDLVKAGLNGDSVNIGNVAIGAVAGAATGKIGGAVGQKVGRRAAKYAAKSAVKKSLARGALGQPGIIFLKNPLQKLATKTASQLIKGQAIKGVLKFPIKLAGRLSEDENGDVRPAAKSTLNGLIGRTAKIVQSATALPTVNIGRGGEYLHNQRYLEALSAADRPLPDTPLAISTF